MENKSLKVVYKSEVLAGRSVGMSSELSVNQTK